MEKDVSKQTVVVLVFLVILVSVLGTFTVLQEAGKATIKAPQGESLSQESSTTGQIKLYIGHAEPQIDTSSAQINLKVTN
ncbi:hypothetical protein K9L67_00780 [Candidatus Woesearchaeota archaeon]|nr:hypothetical protein [Candidatus Woesearchaeota archaeon]MCF7900741.1 hypothetical protein [Candidatus Woesearchaeota archaeon]MCF8012906.1 hypothetical protein [Candidatus Woesearchaeota archaeon]